MVFARSCAEPGKLGSARVVPARAECCEPEHLLDESEHLWAAERDKEDVGPICAEWGRVCILPNPAAAVPDSILGAWQAKVTAACSSYAALPTADGEEPVLDAETGRALFHWPKNSETGQPLSGFDLLLMTVTKPTLQGRQYPTAKEIADAWRADKHENVLYFYNNRHFGITTFEDEQIRALLQGRPPNTPLQPTSGSSLAG
jgi:hypothetical protein